MQHLALNSSLHSGATHTYKPITRDYTVSSEIFASVLFSRNLRSFVKIKPSRYGEITLLFTDIG